MPDTLRVLDVSRVPEYAILTAPPRGLRARTVFAQPDFRKRGTAETSVSLRSIPLAD
ncbi:hypothetical protein [Gluconobacter kondonii]|uniref:hypothetical protein n=1 Tax=Gluconobacter kondonii TaxID=941463 RepID=UPI001B8BBB6C|nr:hypothetical protein [Gluconobacter kondonii]MBS1065620.1 hypothetical protein [Gluconobacter kondonii]MBS1084055.1 hypothetical protein [Gluconobacter kondonii]